MTVKRRFPVLNLCSDESDNSVDRVKQFRDSDKEGHPLSTDVIMVEDSDFSDSDIDILSVEGVVSRRKSNDVWRNIIECDLLDERIKCIGLESVMVHRDTESYELPSGKLYRAKRMKYNQRMKNNQRKSVKERLGTRRSRPLNNTYSRQCRRRSRSRSRHIEDQVICFSTSEDEVEIIEVTHSSKEIVCKDEKIKGPTLIDSETDSSSDDDDNENNKLNSWSKLMEHLHNNKYQIEFEDSRRRAAVRISGELRESKTDLIERCLIYLGLEKCLIFLDATKKIEGCGGMPTKDGSRRRTPGGVFLTMIKSDRKIDDIIKEQIFLDTDNDFEENATLWWKSLETYQFKRSVPFRGAANYARKKEFKSYTLLDLDYFESIRDFRYRYIPIMTNFPLHELRKHIAETTYREDSDDMCMITQVEPPAFNHMLNTEGHVGSDLLNCKV